MSISDESLVKFRQQILKISLTMFVLDSLVHEQMHTKMHENSGNIMPPATTSAEA